jgi:hypothetical protein
VLKASECTSLFRRETVVIETKRLTGMFTPICLDCSSKSSWRITIQSTTFCLCDDCCRKLSQMTNMSTKSANDHIFDVEFTCNMCNEVHHRNGKIADILSNLREPGWPICPECGDDMEDIDR